ncbi:MAG: transcriptional regulator [Crenarchaeota archaeon]|nr:transcriptional regulator [Thermoproteota archaeon]
MHRKDAVGMLFILLGLAIMLLAWSTPFLPPHIAIIIIEALVIAAASVVGAVLAWIGIQLLTTPPPKPVEELERELREEIEEIKREVMEKLKDRSRG